MLLLDLKQGSPEWLAYRKTKITASEASAILGLSKYSTKYETFLQKTDKMEPTPLNSNMAYGLLMEPKARAWYCEANEVKMEPAVVEHKNGWLMASLDGMTENGDALLEIKVCDAKRYEAARNYEIWPDHMIQLQIQLACVPEAQWVDYMCVHRGVALREIRVCRENIDDDLAKLHEFWLSLKNGT